MDFIEAMASHPSRVRGLKPENDVDERGDKVVAPFTGAWIETSGFIGSVTHSQVAPFTGAWIETAIHQMAYPPRLVAPFTGAWIETSMYLRLVLYASSRTLHGCVD